LQRTLSVMALELRQRAQVNEADSAVDEADSAADEADSAVEEVDSAEDEEEVVEVAGVSAFNFNEDSATSGIPVNSPTSLVEVVVEGMVKAKAKDLVALTEDEDEVEEVEEATVAAAEAVAIQAGHHREEEVEVMAVEEHHKRDILRTAVSRVAVVVAPMGNREVVDMVNSHRLLRDTGNKDQRAVMEIRGPEVDTDNSRTVTDNREDQLLLAATHNRVAVEVKVDITSRHPEEAEGTVSSQHLITDHLPEVPEDMVNRTMQHQAGTLEVVVVVVATGSSNSHLLRQTATGAVEATPLSTKLAIRRLSFQDITEPCS